VLAAATPLVTPYAFNYDLTWLAAVQVWMLSGRLPWRPEWSVLCLLGWALPLALMYAAMLGFGIAPLVLIFLFCASLREAVGETAPTPGEVPESGPPRWPRAAEA
jgi:alpha-1,2-mannosyltransferase